MVGKVEKGKAGSPQGRSGKNSTNVAVAAGRQVINGKGNPGIVVVVVTKPVVVVAMGHRKMKKAGEGQATKL